MDAMKYRRVRVQGGTYFFTLVTNERRKIFNYAEVAKVFVDEMQKVQQAHPFQNVALAILPDHLHTIWTLPDLTLEMQNKAPKGE